MNSLSEIKKDRLEEMVNVLTDLCLEYSDAQAVDDALMLYDFTVEERKAMGFDV